MDDKSSSLKLYVFSSADAEQWQDQQQLPVEENKGNSFTGPLTCAAGLKIRKKPYGGKINPSEFYKRLDQVKNLFKQVSAPGSAKERDKQVR